MSEIKLLKTHPGVLDAYLWKEKNGEQKRIHQHSAPALVLRHRTGVALCSPNLNYHISLDKGLEEFEWWFYPVEPMPNGSSGGVRAKTVTYTGHSDENCSPLLAFTLLDTST